MFNDYSFGIKTTATFGDKGKQVDKTHASLIGTTHNVCHTHTFVLCVIFIRERPQARRNVFGDKSKWWIEHKHKLYIIDI